MNQRHSPHLNEENLPFHLRLQGSERLWVSQVKSSRKFPKLDGFNGFHHSRWLKWPQDEFPVIVTPAHIFKVL